MRRHNRIVSWTVGGFAAGLGLVLGSSVAQAAPAGPASDGAALFAGQCAACHGTSSGEAPTRADLSQKTPDEVVQALTTGAMQYMAAGLSPEDIRAIAVYLTGKPPSTVPAAPPK